MNEFIHILFDILKIDLRYIIKLAHMKFEKDPKYHVEYGLFTCFKELYFEFLKNQGCKMDLVDFAYYHTSLENVNDEEFLSLDFINHPMLKSEEFTSFDFLKEIDVSKKISAEKEKEANPLSINNLCPQNLYTHICFHGVYPEKLAKDSQTFECSIGSFNQINRDSYRIILDSKIKHDTEGFFNSVSHDGVVI